jgi:fumarate reductase flavoprotein subunit
VIIASGGYGNNQELLTDNLKNVLYYGPESSTGDGIILTETDEINAATRLMEYGKTYPNGVEVSKGKAKSTIAGNIAVFKQNAILINANGRRVVNERASNREILEVELAQPEQMLYLLMDQEAFDLFKPAVAEAGISGNDIEKWLENNGSTTPYFFHGDTINELAEAAAIDATNLNRTIDTYNGYVEAKEDKEFQRPVEFMPKKIGEGPYYLVEQKPRFATTMGGLVANEQLQVINKEGEVILGLYVAGEIVGGVMGDDSPSGANNAWALTSGKLASESLAEKIK